MLDTIRKCLRMLTPVSRRNYLLLLPLALASGLAEMGAAAGVFGIILILSDPAKGLAVGWIAAIVRHLPWQDQTSAILQLTALLALLYIAKSAFVVGVLYFRIRVTHTASAGLSCDMLRRYLAADYPFHFARNSSDLIRNCTTTVDQALSILSGIVGLATDSLMALGMIAVLLVASPGLSVVAGIVLFAIVIALLKLTRHAAARFGRGRHDLSATTLRSLQQALGGVKELKALGREAYFYDDYAARQREAKMLGYLIATLDNVPMVAIQTGLVCGALGLVAVLTVLGRTGVQTLPIAAVFGYSGLRILPMANSIIATLNQIRVCRPAVNELYDDYVALAANVEQPATPSAHVGLTDTIALERVSYTYPGAPHPAIADISLTIRRGESIGIIGPTGAGKSTLVDLVLGLLRPTSGRIAVDGIDLASAAIPWKRRVGYVPQTIYLIDDTLRRNIALGIPEADVDDARIREVLKTAQLREFAAALPDGLDSPVGERGIRLSGGERQRIAIARALYHDPDVIIFDEATSSLDVETEAEITRTITALRSLKTVIVIAHRLSSVKACDRLVWLNHGRVVDVGSFDDLRSRSDAFKALTELAAV